MGTATLTLALSLHREREQDGSSPCTAALPPLKQRWRGGRGGEARLYPNRNTIFPAVAVSASWNMAGASSSEARWVMTAESGTCLRWTNAKISGSIHSG